MTTKEQQVLVHWAITLAVTLLVFVLLAALAGCGGRRAEVRSQKSAKSQTAALAVPPVRVMTLAMEESTFCLAWGFDEAPTPFGPWTTVYTVDPGQWIAPGTKQGTFTTSRMVAFYRGWAR